MPIRAYGVLYLVQLIIFFHLDKLPCSQNNTRNSGGDTSNWMNTSDEENEGCDDENDGDNDADHGTWISIVIEL